MTTITIHRPETTLTQVLEKYSVLWGRTVPQIENALHTALQYATNYAIALHDNPYESTEIHIQYDLEILAVYKFKSGRKFVMGGIPRPESLKRNQYGGEDFKYSFHS